MSDPDKSSKRLRERPKRTVFDPLCGSDVVEGKNYSKVTQK